MPKILIVDDEPGIRFGVRDFLESEGLEVDEADSIASAEKAVREGTPTPWSSTTCCPTGPPSTSCPASARWTRRCRSSS